MRIFAFLILMIGLVACSTPEVPEVKYVSQPQTRLPLSLVPIKPINAFEPKIFIITPDNVDEAFENNPALIAMTVPMYEQWAGFNLDTLRWIREAKGHLEAYRRYYEMPDAVESVSLREGYDIVSNSNCDIDEVEGFDCDGGGAQ